MTSSKDSKSDNPKTTLAEKHDKWQRESAAIRKVQISLDFPDAADILLRTLAAREHKAPSAMIREIVGMPSSPPKRARIGVSFNEAELAELGERYGIDPNDKAQIRRKLTEEVTSVLSTADSGPQQSTQPPAQAKTTASKRRSTAKGRSKAKDVELTSAAMRDLKTASDNIHERFQQALAKRNDK